MTLACLCSCQYLFDLFVQPVHVNEKYRNKIKKRFLENVELKIGRLKIYLKLMEMLFK